ncbi:MAG TPA: PQQ-binding-like beta-propeller repeat protein, partial [Symbiobacteriaceae bacterium]|nr:PQQ-binding-like beta-propeller repeat protein [Symbiobacteriaceae bacterium]
AGTPSPTMVPLPTVPLRSHVVAGPLLIGVGADQRLHALDAATRETVWLYALSASCDHPPAVVPRQLVVALTDGAVEAFRFD